MSHFVRTFKRRKAFLDELALGSSDSRAAQAGDGPLRAFKKWRNEDPDFAKDWEDAIEEGTDLIEDVATDRAMLKSDPLMIMMLKARRPDKYDRGGKLELSGSVNVEGSKQKLLNRLARLKTASAILSGPPAEESEVSPPENEGPAKPKLLGPPDGGVSVAGGGERTSKGGRRKAAA